MSEPNNGNLSRRDLFKTSGQVAAATAMTNFALPRAFAAENNTVQIALVGCGGRGTGAAGNAMSSESGPVKLVAMADVFENRMDISHKTLKSRFENSFDVPEERKFIGFDAYKKAMDVLNPGDIVILTTPVAFRGVMFAYAISKKLNVFMEKPVTVDGPTSRRMFDLGEESVKAGLKVGVGLMCRHCEARGEMFNRIQDGEIGDLVLLRAYRMAGPTASAFSERRPEGTKELHYQIQRFHSFLWASGGAFSDFLIHNIDECCWMKNDWPIEARASGGRHYRGNYIDQNFDSYSVEYTYPDGSKLQLEGRCISGCQQKFASYAHGTKGSAVISSAGHAPSRCRTHSSQNFNDAKTLIWRCQKNEPSPYQLEWDHLLDAIRNDEPYNEVKRGTEASLVTAMGRFAAHTGQVVTRDQMLNNPNEFAPDVDKLTLDSEAPIKEDKNGAYPVPQPGIKKSREY